MRVLVHYEARLWGIVPNFWELRPLHSQPSLQYPRIVFFLAEEPQDKKLWKYEIGLDKFGVDSKPSLDECRSIIAEATCTSRIQIQIYHQEDLFAA